MISSRLELHIQQEMIKSLIASQIGFNAKFMFNGYTALETSYGDDCPEKIKGLICANDNLLILNHRNVDKLEFPIHVVEKYTNSCGEQIQIQYKYINYKFFLNIQIYKFMRRTLLPPC